MDPSKAHRGAPLITTSSTCDELTPREQLQGGGGLCQMSLNSFPYYPIYFHSIPYVVGYCGPYRVPGPRYVHVYLSTERILGYTLVNTKTRYSTNFYLQRYPKNSPSWSLFFSHDIKEKASMILCIVEYVHYLSLPPTVNASATFDLKACDNPGSGPPPPNDDVLVTESVAYHA